METRICRMLIAGTLMAVAGCGSGTPSAPALSTTPAQTRVEIDGHKKPYEILTVKSVTVQVQSCASGAGEATVTGKGKAKGHYRGKLTISGAWNFVNISGTSFWTFGETFKINGHHPITGSITGTGSDAIATCKTFGPVKNGKDLSYQLGAKTGSVTATVIKNGSKLVQLLH